MKKTATPVQPVVAVDFDGTLCKYAFPRCGEPREDVVRLIRALADDGWRIIIHSARVNTHWHPDSRKDRVDEMIAWLFDHQIPFDQIWGVELQCVHSAVTYKHRDGEPMPEIGLREQWAGVTDLGDVGKPVAHVYLDDRAPLFQAFMLSELSWQVRWLRTLYRDSERDHEDALRAAAPTEEPPCS